MIICFFVLTIKIKIARIVIKVHNDWLDIVEGYGTQVIIPKIKKINGGSTNKEVRF
jgi:hypothetical protein